MFSRCRKPQKFNARLIASQQLSHQSASLFVCLRLHSLNVQTMCWDWRKPQQINHICKIKNIKCSCHQLKYFLGQSIGFLFRFSLLQCCLLSFVVRAGFSWQALLVAGWILWLLLAWCLVFSSRSLAFLLGIFGLSLLEDGFSSLLDGSAAFVVSASSVFLPRRVRLVGTSFGLSLTATSVAFFFFKVVGQLSPASTPSLLACVLGCFFGAALEDSFAGLAADLDFGLRVFFSFTAAFAFAFGVLVLAVFLFPAPPSSASTASSPSSLLSSCSSSSCSSSSYVFLPLPRPRPLPLPPRPFLRPFPLPLPQREPCSVGLTGTTVSKMSAGRGLFLSTDATCEGKNRTGRKTYGRLTVTPCYFLYYTRKVSTKKAMNYYSNLVIILIILIDLTQLKGFLPKNWIIIGHGDFLIPLRCRLVVLKNSCIRNVEQGGLHGQSVEIVRA